ncbi:MAG: Spy/CpxP family protein refolding chaperone [Gemmatimonadaceae bacterium]
MRKITLMGLGLALSLAGTAVAQQTGQDVPRRPRAEGKQGPRSEGRRGGPDGLLLKDIALTEGQRAQIAQLRKAERDKVEARREQGKKQVDEMRAARERGDTTAARAIRARNRQAMEQERAQHIAAIRTVLTADQRVQFDKNVAELKQREQERGARFGKSGRPGGPGGQRGHGGDRPGRFGR